MKSERSFRPLAFNEQVSEQKHRGIPSLDGMRAISIILVIMSHISVNIYHQYGADFTRWQSIVQMLFLVGHLGVTVFFVISGFLITTLLLKEEKINLKQFYFRRTLRIFPPYYFYLICVLAAGVAGFLNISWYNFVASATYSRNYLFNDTAPDSWYFAHTWSLSVEEQFYLLFPTVLLVLGKKRGLTMVALVLAAAPILRIIYVLNDPGISVEFGRFETVADSLAVGCLLAGFRTRLHETKVYKWLINSNLPLAMPFLAVFITWAGLFPKLFPKAIYVGLAITIQNLAIALLLDWVVTNWKSRVGAVLNTRPIVYIGVLSYSIYLWQQPFLNPAIPWPVWLKLLLLIVASLFSYYIVEAPALRFRQYLEKKRRDPKGDKDKAIISLGAA